MTECADTVSNMAGASPRKTIRTSGGDPAATHPLVGGHGPGRVARREGPGRPAREGPCGVANTLGRCRRPAEEGRDEAVTVKGRAGPWGGSTWRGGGCSDCRCGTSQSDGSSPQRRQAIVRSTRFPPLIHAGASSQDSAPKGRSSIARGVSPWSESTDPPRSPEGAIEVTLTAAPSGLSPRATVLHQGLTPLAIDDRPFGAEDDRSFGADSRDAAAPGSFEVVCRAWMRAASPWQAGPETPWQAGRLPRLGR